MMKVRITFDLSEDARIGIANYYNCDVEVNNPPADYQTCKDWIEHTISGGTENLDWHETTKENNDG